MKKRLLSSESGDMVYFMHFDMLFDISLFAGNHKANEAKDQGNITVGVLCDIGIFADYVLSFFNRKYLFKRLFCHSSVLYGCSYYVVKRGC